jgi:hypothetical protein
MPKFRKKHIFLLSKNDFFAPARKEGNRGICCRKLRFHRQVFGEGEASKRRHEEEERARRKEESKERHSSVRLLERPASYLIRAARALPKEHAPR